MKFVQRDMGAAAEASSGGGDRQLAREIGIICAATTALLLALYFSIGWLVDFTLPRISAETEVAWFREFVPATTATNLKPEQTAQVRKLQDLVDRLALGPGVPRIPFRVVLFDTDEVNAFAFPGGTIAVTRGLLEKIDTDIGLSFVLGHEIGHFVQRDHLRGLGRTLGRGIVFSLIFGGGGEVFTSHTANLLDLSYSRAQEKGADEIGLRLTYALHGQTEGSDALFRWLAKKQTNSTGLNLLSTHPQSESRIADLEAYAEKLKRESR
ncbi:M48 family metallopeptidase [Rariglobus hedericola]|uniref:M48 family metallopeptidase n=1 Tax=Rariglobus hedericola TaxID=2597822 RepID=A0A556QSK6_9BACT|nr:M48 family metallopeptidase [Rariglobus hedericola]TSJ79624.1 M48 family metallopeptidase [Rariglobus hedericola]